ncbi:hypothetical protein D3C85_1444340 [compost metagenome]
MRPNPRSRIPPTTAWISRMPDSILASMAANQTAWSQSSRRPGSGPPLLVTSISTTGHAASSACRPAAVDRLATTVRGSRPVLRKISCAVWARLSASRPLISTSQPSCANASAQALPSPREDAHTTAIRPPIPRSIAVLLVRGCQSFMPSKAVISRPGSASLP